MRNSLFVILLTLYYSAYSQGRLVINNDAYVVIDNSAFVVLANPATNAITQLGTGGRIVSESEFDRLQWNIGTNTGLYTIPWSTAAGIEFPLSVNIATAGTGAGNITFSTYNGSTWDNNIYRPSDVTHMLDYATGTVNNSNNVIDRFWIIDPLSYTAKPSATFDITYIDAEWGTVGNTITESDLGAQRFNTGAGLWGDYLPTGTVNTATNIVSGIPSNPANFFRSWTLSETTDPLPIELLSYKVNCAEHNIVIEWTTASESGIQNYVLNGSHDGITYHPIKVITPSGGGFASYNETVTNEYTYYALSTTEISGASQVHAINAVDCGGSVGSPLVYINNGNVMIDMFMSAPDDVTFFVYDAMGKLIKTQRLNVLENRTLINLGQLPVSTGVYFLKIISTKNRIESFIKQIYYE